MAYLKQIASRSQSLSYKRSHSVPSLRPPRMLFSPVSPIQPLEASEERASSDVVTTKTSAHLPTSSTEPPNTYLSAGSSPKDLGDVSLLRPISTQLPSTGQPNSTLSDATPAPAIAQDTSPISTTASDAISAPEKPSTDTHLSPDERRQPPALAPTPVAHHQAQNQVATHNQAVTQQHPKNTEQIRSHQGLPTQTSPVSALPSLSPPEQSPPSPPSSPPSRTLDMESSVMQSSQIPTLQATTPIAIPHSPVKTEQKTATQAEAQNPRVEGKAVSASQHTLLEPHVNLTHPAVIADVSQQEPGSTHRIEPAESDVTQTARIQIGTLDIQITPPPVAPQSRLSRSKPTPTGSLARGFTSSFGLRQG